MKFPRRATTIAVAAASLLAVAAGSVSSAAAKSGSADAKVTINVAALRPGSSDEAQKQFNDNVALFERQHPNIDVKAVEYAWNGATFAAQLPPAGSRRFSPSRSPTRGRLASTVRSLTSPPL